MKTATLDWMRKHNIKLLVNHSEVPKGCPEDCEAVVNLLARYFVDAQLDSPDSLRESLFKSWGRALAARSPDDLREAADRLGLLR